MDTHTLQYSCLENSMDRGAWQATVHEVTTEQLTHIHTVYIYVSPHLPNHPKLPSPFLSTHLFSTSVSLFLLCK